MVAISDALSWSWLIVALPLAGAALIGLTGPLLRARSHWPAILGVGGALACSIWLFAQVRAGGAAAHGASVPIYDWILTGAVAAAAVIPVQFQIDALTAVMLLTVCTVSFLVVIYSRSYMRDHHGLPERGYERFFAFMSLFVASMCILVLAGNFLLLYLGWEAVGLCSYLLIGFYYPRPAAAEAAKKAFIVNRIGDFGFALGVLLIWLTYGRLDYESVFAATHAAFADDLASLQAVLGMTAVEAEAVRDLIVSRATPIALLLFCGAVGKSAQLPLHVWLPDAMEGPTPVSALIHAATMVTAGVYMVARCGAIFTHSALAMAVVAVVGATTAFFAATIALAQFDMKRILAYSTISQLGYMFLGLGVFAADAAIFHLYTHAFFKALLFLGAGSVMHAMAGEIDIRRFGGLAKYMPITAATFWIGSLALAGFPLMSGFWSKDEILSAAVRVSPILGVLGLVTAVITAFYTFRMVFLAFHGKTRLPDKVEHAEESPRWMSVPLMLLAVGAVLAGYVGVSIHAGGFAGLFEPGGAFQAFLAAPLEPYHRQAAVLGEAGGHGVGLMYLSAGLAIAGILVAWYVYMQRPSLAASAAEKFAYVYRLLSNKYFVDEIYDALIVKPLRALGAFFYGFDRYVIDGVVYGVTLVPRAVGLFSRGAQLGAVQGYALFMVAVTAVIVLAVLLAG